MKNQNFYRAQHSERPSSEKKKIAKSINTFTTQSCSATTITLKSSEESSTQTSETIIQLTATESGSLSPDSLATLSPRQEVDCCPKNRPLTNEFLTKSRYTPTIRPSNSYETNFIKSQSFDECNVFHHPNFIQDQQHHHHHSHMSDQTSYTTFEQKSCLELNFMLPTLASEQKNHLRDVQRANQLLPALRRGRTLSPQICRPDRGTRKIPYIDQSTTNMSSATTLVNVKREPFRIRNCKKIDPRYEEDYLKINFKTSLESAAVSTDRTTASTDSIIPSLINKLKNKDDWNAVLKSLAEIIEICRLSHATLVHPHMARIYQTIIELLKSPRTYVSRTACQAAGHLFEYVKDTRKPEFDDIVDILLAKTADANKFIRYDANLALDCMVTHIQATNAIRCLCNKGPQHKNPLVRTATVRLLICSVLINGPTVLLNSTTNETTKRRIFINLGKFLDDKNLDTRKYAERLYKILCRELTFDLYLKKYLNNEQINKIKTTLKLVQKTPQ